MACVFCLCVVGWFVCCLCVWFGVGFCFPRFRNHFSSFATRTTVRAVMARTAWETKNGPVRGMGIICNLDSGDLKEAVGIWIFLALAQSEGH